MANRRLVLGLLVAASCFSEEKPDSDDGGPTSGSADGSTSSTTATTPGSATAPDSSASGSASSADESSGTSAGTDDSTGGNMACGGAAPGLNFNAPESFSTVSAPWAIGVGDVLVDDTYEDLFVAGATGTTVSAFANLLGGGFVAEPDIPLVGEEMVRRLASADLDGDGREDLVAVSRTKVHIIYGNGTSDLAGPIEIEMLNENLWSLALADVVDTNLPDIILGSASTVWVLEGDYVPDTNLSFEVGTDIGGISLGNLDGAGAIDMVVPDVDGEMQVGTWGIYVVTNLEDLGNAPITSTPYPTDPMPWRSIIRDVVGDNWHDVVVTHSSPDLMAATNVLVYEGLGQGQLADPVTLGPLPGIGAEVDIVDMNCDGEHDIVVATLDEVTVFPGDGQGFVGPAESIAVGGAAAGMAIRDFNQDGRPDLAVSLFQQATLEVYMGD